MHSFLLRWSPNERSQKSRNQKNHHLQSRRKSQKNQWRLLNPRLNRRWLKSRRPRKRSRRKNKQNLHQLPKNLKDQKQLVKRNQQNQQYKRKKHKSQRKPLIKAPMKSSWLCNKLEKEKRQQMLMINLKRKVQPIGCKQHSQLEAEGRKEEVEAVGNEEAAITSQEVMILRSQRRRLLKLRHQSRKLQLWMMLSRLQRKRSLSRRNPHPQSWRNQRNRRTSLWRSNQPLIWRPFFRNRTKRLRRKRKSRNRRLRLTHSIPTISLPPCLEVHRCKMKRTRKGRRRRQPRKSRAEEELLKLKGASVAEVEVEKSRRNIQMSTNKIKVLQVFMIEWSQPMRFDLQEYDMCNNIEHIYHQSLFHPHHYLHNLWRPMMMLKILTMPLLWYVLFYRLK